MRNRILNLFVFLFLSLMSLSVNAVEQFNFDVTEIEILEDGNKFIGTNRGKITTIDGIEIEADRFEYIKDVNLLSASGNIKIIDNVNDYLIFTENLIYKKNENILLTKENSRAISSKDKIEILAKNFEYDRSKNIILTKENSRAISSKDKIEILAKDFEYDRSKNIINAKKNVIFEDKIEDYKIYSQEVTYELNEQKIYTKGKTTGLIKSKYNFESEDIFFFKNTMELRSKKKMTIKDNFNLYNVKNFIYHIESGELKGDSLLITSNYDKPSSDKFYFSSAIINLKKNEFIAKDTEIKIHKNIFDNSKNDPRLFGISSNKKAT